MSGMRWVFDCKEKPQPGFGSSNVMRENESCFEKSQVDSWERNQQGFSNSLIIHEGKSVPWRWFGYWILLSILKVCELLLWISPKIMNGFRSHYIKNLKECFIRYPNTSRSVKKTRLRLIFQPTSRGLDILMKHSFSCLICYISANLMHHSHLTWAQYLHSIFDLGWWVVIAEETCGFEYKKAPSQLPLSKIIIIIIM